MGTPWATLRYVIAASTVGFLAWGCSRDDEGPNKPGPAAVAGAGGEGGGFDGGGDGGFGGDGASACGSGRIECDGECVDPASDPKHCGGCRERCDSRDVCSNGRCRASCAKNLAECNGACVDTDLDVRHCGDCDSPCDDDEVCSNGRCGVSCAQGLVQCDAEDGATRCVNPLRDRWNCGGCGVVCEPGYLCSGGTCALTCQVELVECDELCVDPLKDRDYCGASSGCETGNDEAGEACDVGSVCSDGSCALSCREGLVQCGDTCVDPSRDPVFCGASDDCSEETAGAACATGESCIDGSCELVCPGSQIVCGGRCVDRLRDRQFCGATLGCGVDGQGSDGESCAGGEVCSNGTCLPSCQEGLVECDGECVDPLRDRRHCGVTDLCEPNPNAEPVCAAGYVCNAGECSLSCPGSWVKCTDECIDPSKDIVFCGATPGCGVDGQGSAGEKCAPGHVCSSGVCLPECQEGLVECNGSCVVPARDREFCGATPGCGQGQGDDGEACLPGYVCNDGECSLECPGNLLNCAGVCVDPKVDRNYCGASAGCSGPGGTAGDVCAAGYVCNAGECSLSCAGNLVNCAGVCVDPYTDRGHCGATPGCGIQGKGSAGLVCQSGHVCNAGACSLSCPLGLVRCQNTCVDPDHDRNHCGATLGCGVGGGSAGAVCAAGFVCNEGTCDVSCPSELVRCGDTCVDPDEDREHCGATPGCGTNGGNAGVACQPGYVCNNGACSLSCPDELVNCGGVCVDPAVDRLRCGATAGCGTHGGFGGQACTPGNVCASGSCSLSCPTEFVNCSGLCIDPRVDRNYCGATGCGDGEDEGSVCPEGEFCSSASCAPNCQDDLVACDGTCIDPFSNREYCGATDGCGDGSGSDGVECGSGEVCRNGSCVPTCAVDFVLCDGTCIDPRVEREYCGATEGCGEGGGTPGTSCAPGEVCNLGECALSCQSELVECDGTCIDPLTSRTHCGATADCGSGAGSAGDSCPSGYVCSAGQCSLSCAADLVNCGGACVDPASNPLHCGASGNCGTAGVGSSGAVCAGGEVCSAGVCTLSCQSGLVACDGTCVDPNSDPRYCGASADCLLDNAGALCGEEQACVGGQCFDLATLDLDCRAVGGQIWCMYDVDPETGVGEPNRTCDETCAQASFVPALSNVAFLAQNALGECQAIYDAFELSAVSVQVFDQAFCAAFDTNTNVFRCSTDEDCQEYSTATGTADTVYVCACREEI